ncbi:DUF2285 domain-containing protein [Xanthobacter autotrophicus]|uniref:DUF2285 domain-containing protein n=1 Tax=Xanthobacter autotrophicus TaxID=280 RepID=UPI0037281190
MWLPQDDTSVVVLTEAPSDLGGSLASQRVAAGGLGPSTYDGETAAFRHALGNGQYVQVVDHRAASGAVAAAAVIPLDLEGFDRIEAVRRLLSALHSRAIPSDTRLTRQQRARLRKMLQAIDGHRAGATQQEIAQILFKIGHLDRDAWQASSARHGVKALLRDARALIAGGYRKLLRHRRR